MKSTNALGFLGCGLAMVFLPSAIPSYFPGNPVVGSNTSALWLMVMGATNIFIGSLIVLVTQVMPALVQVLAWKPTMPSVPALPVPQLPAMVYPIGLRNMPERRLDRRLAA